MMTALKSISYGTGALELPPPWRRLPVLRPRDARRKGRAWKWTEDLSHQRVVILVPDLTRRCGVDSILPKLLKHVGKAQVIFSVGVHRRQTRAEQLGILGTDALPFRDAGPDYVHVGTTSRGTRVEIDRDVARADRIIGIGRVSLHYFAGFSGGRKLIVPGTASAETCRANHLLVLGDEGRRPGVELGRLDGNPLHEDLMEAAKMAPPTTLINVIGDEVIVSDIDQGFASVCEKFRRRARVKVPKPLDFALVGCGGAPYDVNFIQSHKSLEHVRAAIRPGGSIILAAECPEGYGHAQFAPWFAHGDAASMARALRANYQIYGQTAWATREKTERFRIYMITKMTGVDVMGITKLRSLDEAPMEGRGAVVPFASRTWLTP